MPDQLSGLSKALGEMAKAGITMKYDTIHKVLGEGNFVLVVSEGQLGGKRSSFYDLFRIENDKIAEHWDTIEEIPSKEEWKTPIVSFKTLRMMKGAVLLWALLLKTSVLFSFKIF